MQLNWMGKYRNFLEQLIRFGNLYAQAYKVEDSYTESTSFSPAQIQIMECILENEDNNLKMAEIASNLGITPSSFSKNIKKMTEKGLLEKYHTNHNKKDVIIRVSPFGRKLYEDYVRFAYDRAYKEIFQILDQIPAEYIEQFTRILEISADQTQLDKLSEKEIILTRIE